MTISDYLRRLKQWRHQLCMDRLIVLVLVLTNALLLLHCLSRKPAVELSLSRSHAPAWECISPLTTVDSLSIIHHNQDNLWRLSICNAQPSQFQRVGSSSL